MVQANWLDIPFTRKIGAAERNRLPGRSTLINPRAPIGEMPGSRAAQRMAC